MPSSSDSDGNVPSDPDHVKGSSAIIGVGDKLRCRLFDTGAYLPLGAIYLYITSDDRLWYRLSLEDGGRVKAVDYYLGRQQSGSGQQPPGDGVRSAAGRDADNPDTRGATAGVPAGGGELGAMPDTGYGYNGPVPDFGDDDSHDHPRPFRHDHRHKRHGDHGDNYGHPRGHIHGAAGYDHHPL